METIKLYFYKASGAFSYSLKEVFPSLEFSVSERKVLLTITDLMIVLTGMVLYFQMTGTEGSFLHILKQNMFSLTYGIFIFATLANIFNFYDLETASKTRKIPPLIFFVGITFSVIYILTPVITPNLPDKRLSIIGFILFNILALSAWRIFYIYVFNSPNFIKNILILTSEAYDASILNGIRKKIEGSSNHGYQIQKIYSIPTNPTENELFEKKFDKMINTGVINSVVILDKNHENIYPGLNRLLVQYIQKGIHVQTYLKLYEELQEAIPLNLVERQFYNVFPISRSNSNLFYKLWHRSVDVLSAVFGLGITIFLIPIITIINLFVNKGPLFYSQLRVGKGGKEYKMTKFRSMVVDAESQGAKMSTKGDARIKGFGKILRKLRIDELPQFLAVLKGDMSLIGPRPERKVFVDQLSEEIPFYNARHLVRPGITGWAQVKYPYGENLEDSYNKLEYDLYYIKNRSVTIDIRIIIKTINTVIFSKGQ